jgi:fibronectin-binding autotransporter adhesin
VTLNGNLNTSSATVAAGAVTTNINVTGGSLTVAGDIVRTGGAGTTVTNLKVSGGALDMGGGGTPHSIGSATNAVTLTAESGTLSNVASINGTGGVTKTTTGTLTLAGTNTYTGATDVSQGQVVVSGSLSGSAVSVASGAKLNVNGSITSGSPLAVGGTLSGGGTINAAGGGTTVASGATVSPGSTIDGLASYATLTTNAFASSTGATLKLELSTSAVDGYDRLNVTNTSSPTTLNAGGGAGTTLDVNASAFTYTAAFVDLFFVIINGGSDAVTGTFANATTPLVIEGQSYDTIKFNGIDFAISYQGNSGTNSFTGGNDVVLMAVPEPNSLAILAGSVGLSLGLQRFRRRRI